jgi:hypothetical protein
VAGGQVAIDAVVEWEIVISAAVGTIDARGRLYRDGVALETFRLRRRENTTGTIRYLMPVVWVDAPAAGTHTYELRLFGTPNGNVTSVNAETRAMKLHVVP